MCAEDATPSSWNSFPEAIRASVRKLLRTLFPPDHPLGAKSGLAPHFLPQIVGTNAQGIEF